MRFVSLLLFLSFLLGCTVQSKGDSAESPSAIGETIELTKAVNSVSEATAPPPSAIKHNVPLAEIYFDTFRASNRTVTYPAASDKLKADLLDAIPPLHEPKYEPASQAAWLDAGDMVIGYAKGDQAWAFPIKILNYHEIVNDTLGGEPVLVSYCPLCFSGIVFSRQLDQQTLKFGNTSALYESDMVMVDYETGSYWWQVAGRAIVGELTDRALTILPSQTTQWGAWIAQYPDSQVLSRETGFQRDYSRDVFANYAQALDKGRFAFPVSTAALDDTLPPSTRILSVKLGDTVHAYPLTGGGQRVSADTLAGQAVVVFIDGEKGVGNVFYAEGGFISAENHFTDTTTNSQWNLAGQAISGKLKGQILTPLPTRTSYWFSIIAAEPTLVLIK